jgi:hypothetical protein
MENEVVKFMRIQLLLVFMLFVSPLQSNIANATASFDIKIQKDTNEQTFKDSLFALLYPYVFEAIANFYEEPKQFMNEKIIEVRQLNEKQEKYHFLVKVQLETFEHAHNPPYGKDLITFRVDLGKVTITDYAHKGDEWEKKLSRFKKAIIQEIQKAFNIDFEPYQKYEYGQLIYTAEKQKEMKSLVDINTKIVEQFQQQAVMGFKNVVAPFTFIMDNSGYIVYKKSDGTNIVLMLKKVDGTWSVIKEESKPGKPMKFELFWYM